MRQRHRKRKPHRQYDRSHRLLFSHARTVRDLIRGFIREPWVAELDFSTLEKLPTDYISGQLAGEYEERASDVVWRVRWQGKDLYIVILLELQSTCEQDMALRMLVYCTLFYQRLLKEHPLGRGEMLPPVLPIVFYNGIPQWWAPLDVAELIEPVPASFAGYLPSMRYVLIDEKRWPLADLEALLDNVAAGIVRVEQDHGPEYLVGIVREFRQWLDQPGQSHLRRDILAWLTKVVLRERMPGLDMSEIGSLYDFQTFLEENMQTWPEKWEIKGREEGLRLGMQKGERLGMQKGVKLGRIEGEAAVLLSQVELKFGPPSETIEARIREAEAEELLLWARRLLSAETVEELFESGTSGSSE